MPYSINLVGLLVSLTTVSLVSPCANNVHLSISSNETPSSNYKLIAVVAAIVALSLSIANLCLITNCIMQSKSSPTSSNVQVSPLRSSEPSPKPNVSIRITQPFDATNSAKVHAVDAANEPTASLPEATQNNHSRDVAKFRASLAQLVDCVNKSTRATFPALLLQIRQEIILIEQALGSVLQTRNYLSDLHQKLQSELEPEFCPDCTIGRKNIRPVSIMKAICKELNLCADDQLIARLSRMPDEIKATKSLLSLLNAVNPENKTDQEAALQHLQQYLAMVSRIGTTMRLRFEKSLFLTNFQKRVAGMPLKAILASKILAEMEYKLATIVELLFEQVTFDSISRLESLPFEQYWSLQVPPKLRTAKTNIKHICAVGCAAFQEQVYALAMMVRQQVDYFGQKSNDKMPIEQILKLQFDIEKALSQEDQMQFWGSYYQLQSELKSNFETYNPDNQFQLAVDHYNSIVKTPITIIEILQRFPRNRDIFQELVTTINNYTTKCREKYERLKQFQSKWLEYNDSISKEVNTIEELQKSIASFQSAILIIQRNAFGTKSNSSQAA